MGNVWGMRYRLYLEELEAIADRLSDGRPIAPVFAEEQLVQLVAIVASLLRQHEVNKRGRCRFCDWTRWAWRFWRRRPPCTVFRAVGFVLDQPLHMAWWQVFETFDRTTSLPQVREWVEQRWSGESALEVDEEQ